VMELCLHQLWEDRNQDPSKICCGHKVNLQPNLNFGSVLILLLILHMT
jgi:hypothetical protein